MGRDRRGMMGLAVLAGVVGAAAAQPPGGAPPFAGMLAERFAAMDANHDGAVTRAEYDAFRARRRAEMEQRHKEHRDRDFAARDANHDGALSRREFDAPPPRGDAPPPPPPPGDGDGPPPPPGGAMGDGPPPPPPPPPPGGAMMGRDGDWFARADANGDGRVTLAEAQAAMAQMMAHRGGRGSGGPGRPGPGAPPPSDATGPGYQLPAGTGGAAGAAGYDTGTTPPPQT